MKFGPYLDERVNYDPSWFTHKRGTVTDWSPIDMDDSEKQSYMNEKVNYPKHLANGKDALNRANYADAVKYFRRAKIAKKTTLFIGMYPPLKDLGLKKHRIRSVRG